MFCAELPPFEPCRVKTKKTSSDFFRGVFFVIAQEYDFLAWEFVLRRGLARFSPYGRKTPVAGK